MSSPTIDQFLSEIARILREHNGSQLQSYLILEPPLPPLYNKIVTELKQVYPAFNQAPLEKKVENYIPEYEEGDDGGSNASFITFLVKYFTFLRDFDVDQLVETHDMLKSLLKLVLSPQSKKSVHMLKWPQSMHPCFECNERTCRATHRCLVISYFSKARHWP